LRAALSIGATIFALCFGGCTTDNPCSTVDCLNFGLCGDGTCLCVAGYEGDVCQFVIRDRIIGQYQASEACITVAPFTYSLFIETGQNGVDNIIIGNFGNRIIGVNGYISGNGITIPPQHISVQSGWVDVEGQGLIGDSTITVSYTLFDGSTTDQCSFSLPLL